MAWPSLLPSLLLRYEYLVSVNALLEPSYRQLILYRACPSHTHVKHYLVCKLEVCIWRIYDTLTFNFFLAIFNCTPRFAYELWPDETNKLIKRFRKPTNRPKGPAKSFCMLSGFWHRAAPNSDTEYCF